MASDQSTADFIVEQIASAGEARSRKMFGEFAVYLDDKVVAFICDNKLFLKITEASTAAIRSSQTGEAYPGSKPYYVVPEDDWDDATYLATLIRTTADSLPAPKKKKS